MRRRRVVVGLAAGCLLVAAGAVAFKVVGNRRDTSETAAASENANQPSATATVERKDLTRELSLNGTIGHGATSPLGLSADGVLTWLPATGDVVEPGGRLAEVNGAPVVLLKGQRPAWRPMMSGVSSGEDIRQLESALIEMGFSTVDALGDDAKWTSATTVAVKKMQTALAMPVDGRVEMGEIVFRPAAVRIAAVAGHLGDAASSAGITASGTSQFVSASLKAKDADEVAVGDKVTVELLTGETIDATVTEIGSPAVKEDGSSSMPVTVDAGAFEVADGVPVEVRIAIVDAEGVLAVPVEALLALAEGGYAVEIPDSSTLNGRRLVGVTVGVFSDGWVQVEGDLAEGDEVIVP